MKIRQINAYERSGYAVKLFIIILAILSIILVAKDLKLTKPEYNISHYACPEIYEAMTTDGKLYADSKEHREFDTNKVIIYYLENCQSPEENK